MTSGLPYASRRRGLALAAALAPALLAAGCGEGVDSDQARICRTLLPAINPSGTQLQLQRVGPGPEPATVRIVYRATEPEQPARTRFAVCRFAGAGMSGGRQDLVGLTTEAGPMAMAPLFFLRRFYLADDSASLEDPGDPSVAGPVPHTSLPLAYGLQQVVSGLPVSAVYGLLAAAYSLVYGLVGRIVFGFGELAAIGGYAALLGIMLLLADTGGGLAPALALGAALAVGAATLHGIVAGRIAVAPLLRAGGLPVLIATTGMMIVLSEGMRLLQGPDLRWVPPMLNSPIPLARAGSFVATVTPMAIAATLLCALAACAVLALLAFTRFGRAWRAFADDPRMAALLGVDGARLFALTFALSAALAGLAGFTITVHFGGGIGYGSGLTLGLKALVAAIVGGIGSVPGAFLGGLAIGLAESLWSATMPIDSRDIAVYVLLSLVLALRPGGLFGWRDLGPRRV